MKSNEVPRKGDRLCRALFGAPCKWRGPRPSPCHFGRNCLCNSPKAYAKWKLKVGRPRKVADIDKLILKPLVRKARIMVLRFTALRSQDLLWIFFPFPGGTTCGQSFIAQASLPYWESGKTGKSCVGVI